MRNVNSFKTILLSVILILLGSSVNAQCDYSDDFTAFKVFAYADNYSEPYYQTSPAGWEAEDACRHTVGSEVLYLGGGKIAEYARGLLRSPLFSDGCTKVKLSYKPYLSSQNTKLKVAIKQANNIVWSDTIIANDNTTWKEFSANVNISGAFNLVLENVTDAESQFPSKDISIKNICLTAPIPAHTFSFNVPKDATVFVGEKDQNVTVAGNYLKKHYIPFTEKPAVYVAETDTSKIWYYNVSKIYNYRVSKTGGITQVGTFTPKTTDTTRLFTDTQLLAHSPKEIDHDVTHLAGRNIADVYLNINAQGYLTLPLRADTAFQIVNCRNWQAIDTDVNNYFIDPDFHYTVVNENGAPDNSVVTVSNKGLIAPVGAGTAIVLVNYDAMMCYHTTNVGGAPALFSALWPENTGVFVVSVNAPETNIKSNMLINEYWSELNGTDKVDSTLIDAELDVLYYESDKGSFPYTFKPEGVTAVKMATPTVGVNSLSYNGFTTDSVTTNADGSYTIRLGFGRNIVKLSSATGAEYQVITAKPVTYTISNITDPGETFQPGDSVSVLFNTLYHPCNKLSGIYNMSAGIQYTGADVNFPLILGPGQYTFASRAQGYKILIPDTITSNQFDLTRGVLKVKGFGSNYGEHRNITLQSGVAPNLNASVRTGYFGSLPDIHLQLKNTDVIAPSVPTDLTGTPTETTIALSWTVSTDNVGVTGYNVYVGDVLKGSTTGTSYTVTSLTPSTAYTLSVEAFDAAGNKSAKASVTLSTSTATGIPSVSENNISVYPNPFDSFIVLETTTDGNAVIYDLSGKPVLQVKVYAGTNRINTSELRNGVYVLKYGLKTVRIVK